MLRCCCYDVLQCGRYWPHLFRHNKLAADHAHVVVPKNVLNFAPMPLRVKQGDSVIHTLLFPVELLFPEGLSF